VKIVNFEQNTTRTLVQSWAEFGNGILAGVLAGRHILNRCRMRNIRSCRNDILSLINIQGVLGWPEIQLGAPIKLQRI
jgi:hypothetical protein